MRISDWSSYVCSSDLVRDSGGKRRAFDHEAQFGVEVHRAGIEVERADEQPLAIHCKGLGVQHRGAGTQHRAIAAAAAARAGAEEAAPGPLSIGAIGPAPLEKPDTGLEQDRKSVVEGKRVSVRVS